MRTPEPPGQLIDHIRQRKCVLFVGAGLSMQAGLPSWPRLLRELVDELWNLQPGETEELKQMLERGKLLEVAEYCKHKDAHQFISFLEQRVRGADCPVPEVHRLVARIPFAGVVTTNYDKLLERGWREENAGEPKILTHKDAQSLGRLLLGGGPFILKAHGDIDRTDSIVLTAKDYQEIIHGGSAFESVFSAILLTRVILFVGYSLSDPDFRLMMEQPLRRFERIVPPRFALMAGMGEIERSVLKGTSNVEIIPYQSADGTHGEVVGFLRRLEKATAAAPTVRATKSEPPGREALVVPARAVARETEPGAVILRIRMEDHRVVSSLSTDDTGWSVQAPEWGALRNVLRTELTHWNGKASSLAAVGEVLTRLVHEEVVRGLTRLPDASALGLELLGQLEILPWEWLRLAWTSGKRAFLAERFDVFRRPSGVPGSDGGYGGFDLPARVLLVADPESPQFPALPGALAECEEIAAKFRQAGHDVTLLAGAGASYTELAECVRAEYHDVIHFAGHAWADAQSSFLLLAGDEYLRASELAYLIGSRPPALMFLNSHFTSFVPLGLEDRATARVGEESSFASTGSGKSGLSGASVGAGVGAFIGTCHDSLSDEGAKSLAIDVYGELLSGHSIGHALAVAVRKHMRGSAGPEGLFYTLTGHPHLKLPAKVTART